MLRFASIPKPKTFDVYYRNSGCLKYLTSNIWKPVIFTKDLQDIKYYSSFTTKQNGIFIFAKDQRITDLFTKT